MLIITEKYNRQVRKAFKVSGCQKVSMFYFFDVEDFEYLTLLKLMQKLILSELPVLQKMKLRRIVKAGIFAGCQEEMLADLINFMRDDKTINLDAYIKFRMKKYVNALNYLLYSIVKKIIF